MHYSFKDQSETVSSISLREGETKRISCPFCGGKNTFTVSYVDGKRVWNCYKASCGSKGTQNVGRSIEGIRNKLDSSVRCTGEPRKAVIKFPLPTLLVDPLGRSELNAWLANSNALDAVQRGLVRCMYDPARDRMIFMIDGSSGVGRSVQPSGTPKWLVYGEVKSLFKCGDGPIAVLVEDALSACAVGVIDGYTGVALLGTNLSTIQKNQLKGFERVIIALDKDASAKAISILSQLQGSVPSTVAFLEDDLKYLNRSEILRAIDREGYQNEDEGYRTCRL